MIAPGIELHGSLTLEGWPVFRDLSVCVEPGRWTALLGPSGVGKSSLLRVMAGLIEAPDFAGYIAASDGQPLDNRIAWMAQSDLLLPWADVRANIAIGARLRREQTDHARVDAALQAVQLTDKVENLPAQLSGGQRQRVALARTLYEDRPVVLLDEPFSALDALTRARLQDLAHRTLEGRTVVMVTHEPLEALRLADRILVMGRNSLTDGPTPTGTAPRPAGAEEVLRLQGELLAQLGSIA